MAERLEDFPLDFRGQLPFLGVDAADVRGDGEAWRDGQAGIGHFGQSGALAPQDIFHVLVSIGFAAAEEIYVLRHDSSSLPLQLQEDAASDPATISERSATLVEERLQ